MPLFGLLRQNFCQWWGCVWMKGKKWQRGELGTVISKKLSRWKCGWMKLLYIVSASPLHLAARSGLKQAVQELLSRGASVQKVDENGRSGAWSPPGTWELHATVTGVHECFPPFQLELSLTYCFNIFFYICAANECVFKRVHNSYGI